MTPPIKIKTNRVGMSRKPRIDTNHNLATYRYYYYYYHTSLNLSIVMLLFLSISSTHQSISDYQSTSVANPKQNLQMSKGSPPKDVKTSNLKQHNHIVKHNDDPDNHETPSLSNDYQDGDNSVYSHSVDHIASRNKNAGSPSQDNSDPDYTNYYKEPEIASGKQVPNSVKNDHRYNNNNNNNGHHQHHQGEVDSEVNPHLDHDHSFSQNEPTDDNSIIGDDLNAFALDETSYGTPFQLEKELLTSSLAERTCQLDRGCQRKDRLNNTFLSYCSRHRLELLFSTNVIDDIMHGSSETCERVLDEFIRLDEQINKFHESFKTLLQRYNCHNGYSVKWTCSDCKRAYKDWLCTTNLPYYMNGERVKPCISFCERVEQRCPYLHPITKEQYGGQPTFICKDPNIPFVPEITPNTLHSDAGKCYDLCHLSSDKRELQIDSLSTYDAHCPSKTKIAQKVRDEDVYCQTGPATSSSSSTLNNENTTEHGDHRDINNNLGNKLLPCDHQVQPSSTPYDQPHLAHLSASNADYSLTPERKHNNSNLNLNPNLYQYPLHCEKLNELSVIFESYKRQPKGQTFSHHDH